MQLLTPAEAANVPALVPFSWTAVGGASAYRIWVMIDGGAPTLIVRTVNTSQTVPIASGSVEWYVEAVFPQCPSILSPHGHFTVSKVATCDLRKASTPLSPIGGAVVQSPVTFNWSPVTGALLYRVFIAIGNDSFVDLGVTTQTTFSTDVTSGNVQWYVEALTEGCPPLASARASFVVAETAGCSNAAPIPIAPPANATGVTAPVTFSWTGVANADEYRVLGSLDGGDAQVIAKTTDTTVTKPLRPGTWVWSIEAVFDECDNTRSTKSRFTFATGINCPTTPPQLVSPADGASVTSPIKLDWSGVMGAIGYQVFARHDDGAATLIGGTPGFTTELNRKLGDGSFEWWVVAFFPACPPLESQHNKFTISSLCDNRRPLLFVPHDGANGLTSPAHFVWSRTPNAKSYNVWVSVGGDVPVIAGSTTDNKLTTSVSPGAISWYVEATFDGCPSTASATSNFVARNPPPCATPPRPLIRVAGQVASSSPYSIRWTSPPNVSAYELEEATSLDFHDETTQVISDVTATFTHTASQPTRYFYRVRAISNCSDARGSYSRVASIVVIPQQRRTTLDLDAATGATQKIVLPPQNPPTTFSARGDKPWVTVTPSSGTIGSSGATLTVTTDRNALLLGTNSASVLVTYGASSGAQWSAGAPPSAAAGTTSTAVPISVSLAAPVAPSGKNTPPPDSLIVPAVAHADGLNASMYQSDVRLANTSADVMRYLLNFTLSRTDGTQSGQSTTIEVDPGATLALDDILTTFFGLGSDGGSATGTLEIRPLSTTPGAGASSAAPSVSVASSRTFNAAPSGTFGEFIPAIPFSQFIANTSPKSVLSLQQISQNAAYRTNLGLVEGAGENATVVIHVFDNTGNEVSQIPMALQPGEHRQINSFLQANAINLSEGRVEVEVTSTTGKVSAYASVVDDGTNDPFLVSPVLKGGTSSTRFMLPDVEVDSAANKRSDVRLFNAGTSSITATLAFSPQPGYSGSATTAQVTIPPGQVTALDNVLQTSFNLASSFGALLITTGSSSNLVVTGRTYTQSSTGTFGQFMPAVTPTQSIGLGDRSLQLLQLEDSDQYKTTIGLAETNGKSAKVEVSAISPDSKAYPKVQIDVDANGFVQIPLAGFALGNTYNTRVTVKVISGSGRITAYGSLTDQATHDPTYVPAQ